MFKCISILFIFFFFSSRRRHTRCLSDWSSDVCSSDLGRSLRDAAKSFRVCDSTMQGDKRNLAVKILEFFGLDILVQVRKLPRWKDDLMTSRERLACKHERCH